MSSITFDGLAFVKTIEAAGFSREQAEGIAKAASTLRVEENGFATREEILRHDKEFALLQREIVDSKGSLATKSDILTVKTDLKNEITAVKTDLKNEITAVRMDFKSEINAVRTDLTVEINAVRTDLTVEINAVKTEIAEVKASLRELELRMTVRLGAMIMALGGVLIAIKFLG